MSSNDLSRCSLRGDEKDQDRDMAASAYTIAFDAVQSFVCCVSSPKEQPQEASYFLKALEGEYGGVLLTNSTGNAEKKRGGRRQQMNSVPATSERFVDGAHNNGHALSCPLECCVMHVTTYRRFYPHVTNILCTFPACRMLLLLSLH